MSREEGRWLLSARDHLHILSTRRALMIVSRVRLLSLVFAAGLLLWIAVDFALLPGVIAWKLALLRGVAAMGFAALVPRFRERTSMRSAYTALGSFFFVTTAFIAAASMLINLSAPDVAAVSALAGYGFLPFAMLALLGMFPLTVLECAAFGAPLLLFQAVSIFMNWNVLPWDWLCRRAGPLRDASVNAPRRPSGDADGGRDQAKFCAAKSQFASWFMNVSTNLARTLR